MSTKLETNQDSSCSPMAKKIRCPKHHQKLAFKCESPQCHSSLICCSLECIQAHVHDGKVCMVVLDFQGLADKFEQVDCLISDETIYENARKLKEYIEGLKDSIKNVYLGIKSINQNYDYLKGDLDGPLTADYIAKVEENYNLNKTVRASIQEIKGKIRLDLPMKDSYFSLRTKLIDFLEEHIPKFTWASSKQVFNSGGAQISPTKFHQKLAGVENLLFIIVGETEVVGSFFTSGYPTMAERSKKDTSSFLFCSGRGRQSKKFHKFVPRQDSDQHIVADSRNFICFGNTASYGDGIVSCKQLSTINYCLPSNTYKSTTLTQVFNGILKVKKFMVLQVWSEKMSPALSTNGLVVEQSKDTYKHADPAK